MNEKVKEIAFALLKYLAPFGDKVGRYIHVAVWRNQLIDYKAKLLGIEVTDELRSMVELELKNAVKNIMEQR